MNVTEFKNAMISALRAAGSDLDAWCQAGFGTGCWVRISPDIDDPPDKALCPCVDFRGIGSVAGPDVNPAEYGFSAVLTLYSEGDVAHNDSMVVEPVGVDLRDEFSIFVRDVFVDTLTAVAPNASLSELIIVNAEETASPFFQAGLELYVTEPRTIGASPY